MTTVTHAYDKGYKDFCGDYLPASYDDKELDIAYQLGWNEAKADQDLLEHDLMFQFED